MMMIKEKEGKKKENREYEEKYEMLTMIWSKQKRK